MKIRPRRLAATFVAGVLLLSIGASAAVGATTPATTATGTLPLRDAFTAGFGNWQLMTDGAGAIRSDRGRTGRGMRLTVPAGNGNRAYARYDITGGTNGLVATGWFRVMKATCDANGGWSRGNIPFFRVFDAAGERIAGVFAIKAPCGRVRQVYVQHSYDNYFPTSGRIAVGSAWNRIQLSVTVSTPGRSLVQVLVNGKRVYRSTVATTGVAPIASVQIGNEHVGQQGDIVVDDVSIGPLTATPPTADPCTPGLPAPGASLTAGTVVAASSFEDRTLADWDVRLAGTGRVTVESTYAHDGTCAVHLRSDRGALSRAMLWATLPAGSVDAAAEGWFLVQREGAAASNVPFFRVFRGSVRTVSLYRQNVSGELYLAVAGAAPVKLGVAIPLGEWHQVALHVNASSGLVEVWFDGTPRTTANLTATASAALVGGAFTRVILGNETPSQLYDLWADGVVVSAGT